MSTFKSIHKYYSSCHDDNGNFDRTKAETLIKSFAYYGNERLNILESVYNSVLKAGFINKFSRLYLTNSNMTVRDIGKNYNENLPIGEPIVKEGTSRSQISYCSSKVNEVFKDIEFGKVTFDIVTWLMDANTFRLDNDDTKKELRDRFLEQLTKFIELYVEKPAIDRKDLIISLPRCEKVTEINQEDFDDFMDIIRPYSRHVIRKVQDGINDYINCVGYLKYIMSSSDQLSLKDRENREVVLRWLGKESDAIDNIKDIENKMDNDQDNDSEVIM